MPQIITSGPCEPISSTSIETLWVPLASIPPFGPAEDLPGSGATAELAFVPIGQEPGSGDWHPAPWDLTGPWPAATATSPAGPYWLATILVGPAPGVVQLTEGFVEVWARISRGVEAAEIGPIARLRVV